MKIIYTLVILIHLSTSICQSATFCATSSSELQSALDSANTNNQHNLIKISVGLYDTSGSQFSYNLADTNAGWDLEISGGWSEFFSNPCGQQLLNDQQLSILNGLESNRVLKIIVKGGADITVSNLVFINGKVSDINRGGGLEITSTSNDHTGRLLIERNYFTGNEAGFGSAINTNGFDTMRIKNNFFGGNHTLSGFSVSLLQSDAVGIYFINNTVILNTNDNENFGAGANFSVFGTSNAAIYNNLFWDNENHDLKLFGNGQFYLSHNDIGIIVGVMPVLDTGNITLAPMLESGILIPLASSPLVDTGTKPPTITQIPTPFSHNWSMDSFDIFGNPRTQGAAVDIGAYESTPEFIFENSFE